MKGKTPRGYSNIAADPAAVELTNNQIQHIFDIDSHQIVNHIKVLSKELSYNENNYTLQPLSDMFQDETKALYIQENMIP